MTHYQRPFKYAEVKRTLPYVIKKSLRERFWPRIVTHDSLASFPLHFSFCFSSFLLIVYHFHVLVFLCVHPPPFCLSLCLSKGRLQPHKATNGLSNSGAGWMCEYTAATSPQSRERHFQLREIHNALQPSSYSDADR